MKIRCKECGHAEEVNLALFVKIIGYRGRRRLLGVGCVYFCRNGFCSADMYSYRLRRRGYRGLFGTDY